MDEWLRKRAAYDNPGHRRWSSCDVAHVEIPLTVSAEAANCHYRPMLTCLGYSPASERPGLARWVSGTGRSSLVLIETADHSGDAVRHESQPAAARGLIFETDRRERIDTVCELAIALGVAVLVPPSRYSSRPDEYGLVWCDANGTIFELRYRKPAAMNAP